MNKEFLGNEPSINDRVERFKTILEGNEHEEVIVQKYIVHGTPYVFKDDEDKYFDLKREISAHFSEHYNNIHMIGSAKLGFSISPSKRWRPFDVDRSDIDIAIVSTKLFETLWGGIHEFNIQLTSRTEIEDKNYKRFLDYFFKGWIRPDLLPFKYSRKAEWFDFFKSISYGKYGRQQKIAGALYHSFNFFEKYHIENIKNLRMGEKV